MYQRDYILRIIEQLGRALLQVRNRILGRKDDPETIYAALRGMAQQAGLDLDLARAIDSEMLPMLVAPTGEQEPARCWLYAELLYLEGLQADQDGRGREAERDYRRALDLYALLPRDWQAPADLPEVEARTAEIEARLGSGGGREP